MTMSAAEVARDFLAVVWDGAPPDDETLGRALDRLLAASHDVPDKSPGELELDPPPIDGAALYREAARRFPDYGRYPLVDPLAEIEDATTMLADAIDDLVDITRDLREVIWCDAHLGPDDGAWQFRMLSSHWARHARWLSVYLHARQFG